MANWIHSVNGSQRKKWNLDDRTSLNNLKTQIAQDGCSDIQFDLARQLLSESENGNVENHHQGIHWLLRSASAGHDKAIELLADCYKSGRGINESNECEVRLCLAMSPAERCARKAARELFICLSNGGEFITASQLENKMREIYHMGENSKQRRNKRILDSQVETNAEMFTEANLITAAVNYTNGRLPNLNNDLCVTTPHPKSLDHVPFLFRPLLHPILFLTLLYFRLVKTLACLPELIFRYKIPILVLVYLISVSEKSLFATFIPSVAYLFTFIFMMISTCQILKTKQEFIDFRLWSGLLQHYGRDLSMYRGDTESKFLRNNLQPYFYFFGALFTNLMVQPTVKFDFLPYSELTIISFVFVFITTFAFLPKKRLYAVILIFMSILANLLAKYPYEMDQVMSFFDILLPSFRSYMIGSGIEFRLNFRAMFYLMIPVFLVQIASIDNWRGIYKHLIPHCVSLSWLQLCISCSQYSTMFGLIRAGVELVCTALFLPLLGLFTTILPVVSAAEAFLIDQKIKIIAIICTAFVILILYGYLASNRRLRKYRIPIQVTFYILALFTYVIPLLEKNIKLLQEEANLYSDLHADNMLISNKISDEMGLSYTIYSKYCQTSMLDNGNKINTQIRCTQLNGEMVKWEGVVKVVDITSIQNSRADLLSYIYPKMLRNYIICLLGDKNEVRCLPNEDCEDVRNYVEGEQKCNVNKWNSYNYEIRLKMSSGILKSSEIILVAGDHFSNFTMRLSHLDRIWFIGQLNNKFPSHHIVELKSIGCIACGDKELQTTSEINIFSVLSTVQNSFKYLLNVLFNPILTFK